MSDAPERASAEDVKAAMARVMDEIDHAEDGATAVALLQRLGELAALEVELRQREVEVASAPALGRARWWRFWC